MPDTIDVSPEFKKHKDLYDRLKEELVKLVADRDELTGVVRVNLEAEYHIKIGKKLYDVFCAKVAALRLKRKAELLQAALNRQEQCSVLEVELRLDTEFEQWQQQARELYEKIRQAEYLDTLPPLPPEKALELKKLYRELAKKYHPDVNPGEPEKARNVWPRIAEAFQKGDLQEMKTLALLAADISCEAEEFSAMDRLRKACDALKAQVQGLLDAIAALHAQFPFKLEEKLSDDAWVREQNAAAESELRQWQQARDQYEAKVAELEYLMTNPPMH